MPAECWACVVRLTKVHSSSGEPVGVCQDCGVLGCTGHGEVDRLSGLWVCYKSVAKQAAAGAGLPTPGAGTSPLQIESREDLHGRFAALANAADYMRPRAIEAMDVERDIGPADRAERIDVDLLYDAVAIAAYLAESVRGLDEATREATALFGPLDRLVARIFRG